MGGSGDNAALHYSLKIVQLQFIFICCPITGFHYQPGNQQQCLTSAIIPCPAVTLMTKYICYSSSDVAGVQLLHLMGDSSMRLHACSSVLI